MESETGISELSYKKVLVTGGAGFIGSHLVDILLESGAKVTVFDNLSSGTLDFLKQHIGGDDLTFIEGDLLNPDEIMTALDDIDIVFHVAANPDVRLGAVNTRVHLEQNIMATYNLLEVMRNNSIKNIVFTSTSTVYGEADLIPTPEDYGPLVPISMYGASKLACEALITSYCHTFDMYSWIFRFANIIGDRSTHGIIVDFIGKLKNDPEQLEILGDGRQSKSYLHVRECVRAMMFVLGKCSESVNIFNIGSEDAITATAIGELVVEEMGLQDVTFNYTGGSQGWKGDVPKMMLSIDKLKDLGWEPVYGSEESVRRTIQALLQGSQISV